MPLAVPVDLLNQGRETRWANLGDWGEAPTYPQAAEALAWRLGRAAGLSPGQRVLDAGCGAGDQIRVWVEAFGVSEVTALERDRGLADVAAARVGAWGLDGRVRVRVADAARDPLPAPRFDRVVALDSAYFFRPRSAFLRRAREALRPGGVLALADLTLGTGRPASLARALAPVCGIPPSNLLTPEAWIGSLRRIGYEDVTVDDRTEAVLDGFARWMAGPDRPSFPVRRAPGSLALDAFARALGRLARAGGIGYAVVTARAPRG